MSYYQKYLKYKNKYLELKKLIGGEGENEPVAPTDKKGKPQEDTKKDQTKKKIERER